MAKKVGELGPLSREHNLTLLQTCSKVGRSALRPVLQGPYTIGVTTPHLEELGQRWYGGNSRAQRQVPGSWGSLLALCEYSPDMFRKTGVRVHSIKAANGPVYLFDVQSVADAFARQTLTETRIQSMHTDFWMEYFTHIAPTAPESALQPASR